MCIFSSFCLLFYPKQKLDLAVNSHDNEYVNVIPSILPSPVDKIGYCLPLRLLSAVFLA